MELIVKELSRRANRIGCEKKKKVKSHEKSNHATADYTQRIANDCEAAMALTTAAIMMASGWEPNEEDGEKKFKRCQKENIRK